MKIHLILKLGLVKVPVLSIKTWFINDKLEIGV